jgi:hypothetical protein
MLLPILTLAILSLLIGLFPQFAVKIILNPVMFLIHNNQTLNGIYMPLDLLKSISLTNFAFIIIIFTILVFRQLLLKNKIIEVQNTWRCGYKTVNARMQYTASSYVRPFSAILKPLFIKHFDIKRPKELFPKDAHFNLNIQDIEEFYVVNPIIEADEKFLLNFQWIQGGHTQKYILYGLIFLVMALVGTIFFK